MKPSRNKYETILYRPEGDLDEMVYYVSETHFIRLHGSPLTTIAGEGDFRHAPNPFFKSGAADTLADLRLPPDVAPVTTFTNPLDEQQHNAVTEMRVLSAGERPCQISRPNFNKVLYYYLSVKERLN